MVIIIIFQNAETTILERSLAVQTCCGPGRHQVPMTNVAACDFTTVANTYAAMADVSRKKNETNADCQRREPLVQVIVNVSTAAASTRFVIAFVVCQHVD